MFRLCLFAFLLPLAASGGPAPRTDGDRVVLIGNTLIEREQRYGWWELALTARHPGKKITVRNLGWSGDTVFGHARAGFGNTEAGFKHLCDHTLALKPTVILVGYGTNESFEGPEGLPKFVKGLDRLLDALSPAKARIALLSPMRQGTMPPPLPDPTGHNRNLRLYADAIRDMAKKRGLQFVDLYDKFGDIGKVRPAVTDNGIHFTGAGYRWSASAFAAGLGLPAPASQILLEVPSRKNSPAPVRIEWLPGEKARCRITADALPQGKRKLVVFGLLPGKYELKIDGKPIITADALEWVKGVSIDRGPEFDQVEKLRRAIVAKNELYFHRWRPENVTYLFGFRKHEQGKNAREIPQFDPLVEEKEKEIAKLSVPVPHLYEWVPAGK